MHTVLIVDDEYLIADILGLALEDEGYSVVKANSARKGLEILERERPSVVITDYMMPGMNGAEFAAAIRTMPAYTNTPVVLMTGAQGVEGRATPQLFTRVFDKPFEMVPMLTAINELIRTIDLAR